MRRFIALSSSYALTAWILASSPTLAAGVEGYYRFPDVHRETVVFAAEGDLWTVPLAGGLARRLTTHPGEETHPVFSPDGSQLAFSATYEGPTEVYVMPTSGGSPRRLTWEAEASTALGWTPSGEVLYATRHYSTLPNPLLVRVDPDSLERTTVPLYQASDGDFDATGRILYFARPAFHRNNTKRYRGGTARNIWRFASGDTEAINLTADFAGEDHSPMVIGSRIYWVNDRDGTMNVWSMTPEGSEPRQETFHSGWDVKSPSNDESRIVYQLGADLWHLDLSDGSTRRIPINLASDFDQLREKWETDPLEYLTSIDLHPQGRSVALTARGRVFVFPAGQGRSRQLARKPGVRYRDATFLPDGDVLLLSDETGETEFYRLPADGTAAPEQITDDADILRFGGVPSPDGRWLAYTDKNADLNLLDLSDGSTRRVTELREGSGDPSWSPDSQWLAYSERALNTYQQIKLFRAEDGQRATVTSDRTNSESPVWSPDGQWLYFLSDRNLRSLIGGPWGPRQPEPYFDHPMELFQVALQSGLRPSFRPVDELSEDSKDPGEKTHGEGDDGDTDDEAEARPIPAVQIDLAGIQGRLWPVPVPAGNYRNLSTDGKNLYWLSRDSGPEAQWHLKAVEIGPDPDEPATLVSDVLQYILSADSKTLMVRKKGGLFVFPASEKAPAELDEYKVDLSGWSFPISVREDLRQIFVDAWRLERDYFYDPGMHGLDWEAVRDKYRPLVERATTRQEVSDIIGEVVGELSALHISVRGGDHRTGPDEVVVASLGARMSRDSDAGGYRIDHLYLTDPDYPSWRGPLADPYLEIEPGDTLLAINGTPVLSVDDPAVLLRNTQERQVRLRLLDQGSATPRDVVVVPTADERELRYQEWEYTRRLAVEEAGQGQIGYVHLRAMTAANLAEWYRNFYPVFNRRGLIVDVRHNGGGNIDSIILEKLMRRAWMYWQDRVAEPSWNMQYAFRGHMVVLVDELTGSDGEAFAEGFRRLGLGKVIGTRTWGGEIWLSSNNRLSDGGLARAPQNGVYGPEGEWLIEGWGVEPDIVVDNLPHETFQGRDAQLEAAIEHLQALIAEDPRDVPPPPPLPDKSFEYPDPATHPTGSGARP